NNYNYGSGGVWPYLYTYAKDSTPVIVYISWGKGNGAHAALCVYVYKSDQKCIFLDPGYGLVEFAGSQLPAYTVTDNTGHLRRSGNCEGNAHRADDHHEARYVVKVLCHAALLLV